MKVEDEVRNGILTSKDGVVYKTLFLGKNFHVYRLVDGNSTYRGNHYEVDAWVLAWSDICDPTSDLPPQVVPLRSVTRK